MVFVYRWSNDKEREYVSAYLFEALCIYYWSVILTQRVKYCYYSQTVDKKIEVHKE